jgi:hypothetical protein
MSIQWDDNERAGHFIRLLEQESQAWHEAGAAIQALLPGISQDFVHEAETRVRECHARAEALRKLVRHICEGDFPLLTDPERSPG